MHLKARQLSSDANSRHRRGYPRCCPESQPYAPWLLPPPQQRRAYLLHQPVDVEGVALCMVVVKGIRVSLFLFGTAGRECLLGGGETTHCTLGLSSTIKHRIAIITVTQHVKHNKNVQSIPNLQWAFSVRTPLRNYFSGWST